MGNLWFAGVCALCLFAGGQPGPAETVILSNGEPACAITIAVDASSAEAELAGELSYWLEQIGGRPFSVSRQANPEGIVLGLWTNWAAVAPPEAAPAHHPEAYRLLSDGTRLWLLGRDNLGLQHAVYGFLHELGCRWYFPDPVWTVITRRTDLAVAVDVNTWPAFAYRRIWYGWGPRTKKLAEDYHRWLRHNRQLGHFVVDCGHAYERYIRPREFEQHPEWFSLVDGKRTPRQLCVSNPEVQERMITGVLELFKRHPERNMASVEPNDGPGYCECEGCRAIGSPSDQVFFLANTVARALRAHYPDKWVGLYAYAGHSDPPRFPLEPNVYVKVTTGFRYTKLSFEEQVKRFRELGAKVGVYDYFSVYPWDWDMPGAAKAGRLWDLAAAIRQYHQLELFTYDAESSCNWGPNGPGYWVAAQLMWDPSLEPEELVADFCQRAFGNAAPAMKRMYSRWWRGERFSGRSLKLALLDLEEAYRAESDPAVVARLDRVAMYLHWLRLWWEYNRSARWNQWGRIVTAEPEEILARARAVIGYTRRIMDTGLVHAYPALYSEWLKSRFVALGKLPSFDWKVITEWTKDESIPTPDEVRRDFAADLAAVGDVDAAEIDGIVYDGALVPVADYAPELVGQWGDVPATQIAVESGLHLFFGSRGEELRLVYRPHDSGHTVDCPWRLFRAGWPGELTELSAGRLKAERGQPAELTVELPESGLFAFDPGTDYWKAAVIGFPPRPLVIWAGRPMGRARGSWPPLCLWLPRLGQKLYFWVPPERRHFVLGIVSGGDPYTTVRITRADGQLVYEGRALAGDELVIRLPEPDAASAGNSPQESGSNGRSAKGEILALELVSLRCQLELYDVPPFLARHPAELLIPVGNSAR